MSGEQGLI